MGILRKIVIVFVIFSVMGILFSYLFPGRVELVDSMRLFVQRPVIKWFGKIKADDFPAVFSEQLPGKVDIQFDELKQYVDELPPGSIFLTKTRSYAITEFIPGDWKHTGIFLGTKKNLAECIGADNRLYMQLDSMMNDSDIYVLDSTEEGVSVHPMQNLSNMKAVSYLTNFAAFSPALSKEKRYEFIAEALYYLNRKYDFDWRIDNDDEIFCSELIYLALRSIGLNVKKRTYTFSREVVTPDDLFDYLMQHSVRQDSFLFYGSLCKKNGILEECPVEIYY